MFIFPEIRIYLAIEESLFKVFLLILTTRSPTIVKMLRSTNNQ